MENIINLETINSLPQDVCADVKSSTKTMLLTRRIHKLMDNGASLESAIAAQLPAADPKSIHDAAEQLAAGVDSVYTSMQDNVDEKWISRHLNNVLLNLDNTKRAAYLNNFISLAPAGSVDEAAMAKVNTLIDAAEITEKDIAFLVETAQNAISGNAGVLMRRSVQAMDKVMHLLPKEAVADLTNTGVDTAKAYAAACYVLKQCGENPWNPDGNIAEQTTYMIGAAAATNIEGSKLMALCYTGKINLTILQEKLTHLFKAVITFICEQTVRAIAVGLQIAGGMALATWIADILFFTIGLGLWTSILGSVAVSVFVFTKVFTTQDYVDVLNEAWRLVKLVWNGVKGLWNKVFHGQAIEDTKESAAETSKDADVPAGDREEETEEDDEDEDEEDDKDDEDDEMN